MRQIGTMVGTLFLLGLLMASPGYGAEEPADDSAEVVGEFLLVLLGSEEGKSEALAWIGANWQPGFLPMTVEALTFNRDPATGVALVQLLEDKTGRSFGFDINQWLRWMWNQPYQAHASYAEFKSALYGLIDQRFENYFATGRPATIRLDEILWGGVEQDGIPPLRNPQMIPAGEAGYLADSDVVFGLAVKSDVRAYPRKILAWHEMFVDEVGDRPVVGVYCTLCGTMILYATDHDQQNHELGTSGFLYRSNKLMYDRATQSLWNTLWGKPVLGPLADQDIELERMSVVTTTWGEWRQRHPQSLVLSQATGHMRDYSEGAAYREYFATDELMFQVPGLDQRLRNKDEVLGLVFPQHPDQPLAIAASYLVEHPVYHDRVGELDFVVLTDASGANRVYETKGLVFSDWDSRFSLRDSTGVVWTLDENSLTAPDGRVLHRLPAHRAFWFGWYSAYGHTRLVL